MSEKIKPKVFNQSQFDEQEHWEETEKEKKNEFHEDGDRVGRVNTGNSMLQAIHQRNLNRIKKYGPGYSKDPDKRK